METLQIPKTIHYFWFGENDMPEIFYKCIESWKKYCPDYKIIRWDETNFDVNIIEYTKEAYEQNKYAFVSDYARFYIMEKYGGIYLDIDVEILKNIDNLLNHEAFCGFEYNSNLVNPGLILGSIPHGKFVKTVLEHYNSMNEFIYGTHTICTISTDILEKFFDLDRKQYMNIQRLDGVCIYPAQFFCAYDQIERKIYKTDDTFCIHHYNASWLGIKDKIKNGIRKIVYKVLGKNNYEKFKKWIKG